MDKLRAAIIGCGNIYRNHAEALYDSNFAELKAVVDIDENRALAAANKYKCNYYTDYKKLLIDDGIDVVHICTPHYLHGEMAIESMKAGKQVLVEKPADISVEKAYAMVEAKNKYGKHLGVSFQNRYNDTAIETMKIINNGSLGEIKGIKAIITWSRDKEYYLSDDWRGKWKTEGGGVLINQAIHELDLMQWFGGKIKSVKGNADLRVLNGVIEVEDTADATIEFENGTVGIFYATNCYSTNSSVLMEIHLEKGVLRISDGELHLIQDNEKKLLCYDTAPDFSGKSYWGAGHKKMIRSFYESIKDNDTNGYVTIEEGIKSLRMIDEIYKSSMKPCFTREA